MPEATMALTRDGWKMPRRMATLAPSDQPMTNDIIVVNGETVGSLGRPGTAPTGELNHHKGVALQVEGVSALELLAKVRYSGACGEV
ncbi:hypothetical protein TYRP_019221 [Tyrophagus putrescentiae]|nr:hypothetical protein TYRP_019221 [Tyrophagus putrescentiae]